MIGALAVVGPTGLTHVFDSEIRNETQEVYAGTRRPLDIVVDSITGLIAAFIVIFHARGSGAVH